MIEKGFANFVKRSETNTEHPVMYNRIVQLLVTYVTAVSAVERLLLKTIVSKSKCPKINFNLHSSGLSYDHFSLKKRECFLTVSSNYINLTNDNELAQLLDQVYDQLNTLVYFKFND